MFDGSRSKADIAIRTMNGIIAFVRQLLPFFFFLKDTCLGPHAYWRSSLENDDSPEKWKGFLPFAIDDGEKELPRDSLLRILEGHSSSISRKLASSGDHLDPRASFKFSCCSLFGVANGEVEARDDCWSLVMTLYWRCKEWKVLFESLVLSIICPHWHSRLGNVESTSIALWPQKGNVCTIVIDRHRKNSHIRIMKLNNSWNKRDCWFPQQNTLSLSQCEWQKAISQIDSILLQSWWQSQYHIA